MGSVVRRRSATRRERPRPATTAERWRLLEAIERSRSPGGAGVSGGGRNATLGSVAREPQRERRRASRGSRLWAGPIGRKADCYTPTLSAYKLKRWATIFSSSPPKSTP